MSSKQISNERYVQSGLAHVSTGILVGSLLGGVGVLLVAANYASKVATGKGILSNTLKTRHILQNTRKPRVETVVVKNCTEEKVSAGQAKHALLQVIRSVETPKHQRLRHRATFYTLGVTVCRYSSPLIMALILTTVIGGDCQHWQLWGFVAYLFS